jgi:hypothetical protein
MRDRRWREHSWLVLKGILRRHPESHVAGLELIDLREDGLSDHDQIRQVLEEALDRVTEAGLEYGTLVSRHLERVIVLDSRVAHASPSVRGLYTPVPASERANPVLFAARLVWAASYLKVWRQYSWWQRKKRRREAHKAASAARLGFVDRFPGTAGLDFVEAGPA